jgi:ATP-binding cassette, subfamily B, bacterial
MARTTHPTPSPKPPSLARRAYDFVCPHHRALALVTALALVLATLSAVEPLMMKWLFDELGGRGGLRVLGLAMGGLLALECVRAGLTAWLGTVSWDVRLDVEYALRERVTEKLNALPISYHQQASVGGTMSKVNTAIAGFVAAFGDLAFNLLPTVLYLVLSAIAMARLEWHLAILVLVFTPLPALVGARAAKEQTERERRLLTRWTSLYGRFNEVLAGMLTVKGYAMERAEQQRFLDGVREGNDVVRRGVRRDNLTGALRGFAGTLARLLALGLGGYFVWRGEITIGTLVAFLGYIGGLFGPVQSLTNIYQTVQKAQVALEVVYAILDAEDSVADAPGASDAPALAGEVVFERVTFGYDPARPILRDLSLHVRPGETIALVGPSGSGKTTIAQLLQRFYPAQAGSIRIDGIDIRHLTQQSLRRQIGTVFQDAHLFNDTVRANIAYGSPHATQVEIEAAATAANAHDFIMALPEAYDTVVCERGSRLSGGQRQRVAIARALLKNPPLLILDEATSALDSESERLIQDALKALLAGRTAFVIAHRLSTVVDADRIVVVKDGTIHEVGSHGELLARNGYYASLIRRQSAGILGDGMKAA